MLQPERADAAAGEAAAPLFDNLSPDSDWLELARTHYLNRALLARSSLAQIRESLGNPLGARQAWTSVLELDPLREDAHRHPMTLLGALGQRDAALAHFRYLTDLLSRELGAEPSSETVAIYRELLSA